MADKPQDLYSTFGSVPSASGDSSATVGAYQTEHATPNDFGAQIGAAQEKFGDTGQKVGAENLALATDLARSSTEAKVNDDYANKYAPAAADLRNKYDQLQGQDKINGYDSYINGLQDLNRQFTSDQTAPYGQQLMSGLINRHVSGEIDGAKRELVQSQLQFSNQAAADKVMADSGYAAQNYNNPEIANQVAQSNDATIAIQHLDAGYDLSNPDHQAVVEDAQRTARGSMAVSMIDNALSRGDAAGANKLRAQYGDSIPGYQQLALDNTLHVENMRQTGVNGADAIKNGRPLPPVIGAPPAVVQAAVVDAAQTAGVEQNHALTVAYIESNMGRSVGTRGDIGQTGKGGDLNEQATNMATELKKSEAVASNALGRPAEPWEQYACYQQGEGGGPALLKAAQENPNAKAVDVLAPLYSKPKAAMDAVVNNGGNPTMSASDFLTFIKKRYDDNAARAECEIPSSQAAAQPDPVTGVATQEQAGPPNLAQALIAPHTDTGPVVQPAATPRQTLNNFDVKYPDMVARANAIPNLEVRQAVLKNINQQREILSNSSTAYSSQLLSKADQLAADPKFTDMNQVPSELSSLLLTEHPQTLTYLENKAKDNADRASGGVTKDMKEYGPGMFGLMRDIAGNKINNVTELMDHLPKADGTGGDLTIAGFEKLKGLLIKDPETAADTAMQTQAFKLIKRQLSGEDEVTGYKDPKGEELFSRAMPKLYKALDDGKEKGLTMGQMTDPSSKDWIGNSVQSLKRSPTQMAMDMGLAAAPGAGVAPKVRDLTSIMKDYYATQDPAVRASLKQEAIERGFVRKDEGPSAPLE